MTASSISSPNRVHKKVLNCALSIVSFEFYFVTFVSFCKKCIGTEGHKGHEDLKHESK